MRYTKIAIFGAGSVGSTIAYALMLENIAAEINLIDTNEIRCRGEILDLSDALSFCYPSKIKNGTPLDAKNADIIIIAAGKKQEPGQDRRILLEANKKVVSSIMNSINPVNENSLIIMVTNPVDAMTYYAQQLSNLPKSHIFGSGTFLDTQRLREQIAHRLHIAEQSIHAYILGEHGDSQFPAWSLARIAGISLNHFGLTESNLNTIAKNTKDKAYEIIACKGATFYGIASCVTALCRTIIFNQKRITPLSCYIEKYGICLSLPVILGAQGIEKILDLPLNEHEQKKLDASATILAKLINS